MKISIIGAGYVGLPLAIAFSKYYHVVCYDVSKERIDQLNKGFDVNKQYSHIEIMKRNLSYTNNDDSLLKTDVFIVTVPTPIDTSQHPDLSMLKKASILVGKYLKKKNTVIYESTTFPGCTTEVCLPLLEKYSNLNFKSDFSIAYSPERVNPGDKVNKLNNITKIVAAEDNKTLNKVDRLYKKICKSTYPVLGINIGESAKIIENVQRDINIALVNELSVLFNKLKIPTNEVLRAAASKWNFHYYKPGLVGGHCIGIDPYYLSYKAEKINYYPQLILSGRRFNENMGNYVAKKTLELLSQNNISLNKAKIAILGFSFKENIPDIRNTKIIQIIEELNNWNVETKIYDSIVFADEVKKTYGLEVQKFSKIKYQKFDAIIFAVSHNEFKTKLSLYNKFFKNQNLKILIDVKNNFSMNDLIKNKYKFFQL